MKVTKRQLRRIIKETWFDSEAEDSQHERLAFLDAQVDIWADTLDASSTPGMQQHIRQGLEDLYDRLFDDSGLGR